MRTFMAIDLDDIILDRLQETQRALEDPAAKIRWVDRANLHLTMAFLGDVPDAQLHEVCQLAAGAASMVQPFELAVQGLQCVPAAGPMRMVWADIADSTGNLEQLHKELDAALGGLGLHQEERCFKPHVTLARVKHIPRPADFRRLADPYRDTEFGIQQVEELVTYSSLLTADGPVYTPLARAKLGE